jgi:hypothetical protein
MTAKTAGGAPTAPDGGELGGIALGMEEWDDYKWELKVWEAAEAKKTTHHESPEPYPFIDVTVTSAWNSSQWTTATRR